MVTQRRQRFAGIELPQVEDPSLAAFIQAVKDRLEQSTGDRGEPLKRFVTMQDLKDAGLAKVQVKGKYAVAHATTATTGGSNSSTGDISVDILAVFAAASVASSDDLPGNNQFVLYDPVDRTVRRLPASEIAFDVDADYDVTGNWAFENDVWIQTTLLLGNDDTDDTEGLGHLGDIPMQVYDPTLATPTAEDLVTRWHTPGNITRVNDTNVTLTLGGTPTAAVLQAVSLTLGWTGVLAESRGGTNRSTYTKGDLLYASAANVLSVLAIGTSGYVLAADATGVPVWAPSATGIVTGLDDVPDVNAPTPADGDVLTWDSGTTKWIAAAPPGGGSGTVDSVVGTTGEIVVNNTDPANPVVSLAAAVVASLALADSSVQPGDLATVATTGDVDDLVDAKNLTKTDDTNVTLTLGGTPTGSLIKAVSLTLGWTGQLSAGRGGTGIGSYAAGDLLYATGSSTLSKLAIGTAGYALRVPSSGTALYWDALCSDIKAVFEEYSDLIGGTSRNGFDSYVSVGGTVATQDGTAGHPGQIRITTSTSTATSNGFLKSGGPSVGVRDIVVGGGELVFESSINIGVLWGGGNTGQYRAGFMDEISGAPTYGVHMQYDDTSANWKLFARNSTSTSVTGGTAVTTGWHFIRIVIDSTGSSAELFVDGVSQGTVSTNMPGTGFTYGAQVQKSAGTTAAIMDVDAIKVRQIFTTPR